MKERLDRRSSPYPKIEQEFIKSQFEQAMETYRTSLSLLIQVIAVLVIANATVVGYAISTQISGILFIGPLFPITIMCIAHTVFKLMLPIIYTAMNLEHKYDFNIDFLATTFLSVAMSPEYVDELTAISSIQDPVERTKRLRGATRPLLGSGKRIITGALILIALGQIIAPIILSMHFGWRLL